MLTPKNPIPTHAKKVFDGVIFDVYQWEQEMFDGSLETFEMLRRKPSTNVIATVDDKIILLWQEQPMKPLYPGIPGGGFVETEETAEDAAKRELLEETGFVPGELEFWSVTNSGGTKMDYNDYLYIARGCQKVNEQNLDAGEKIQVTLVSFDEFLEFARNRNFTAPLELKFDMYEALLSRDKKEAMRKKIFKR